MDPKKLLAILASPHKDGLNAQMLRCAADAARAAGWQVDWVWLYDTKLAYCTGCRCCVKTGECVLQDDQQHLAELLRRCDVAAVAAPTYWANVPAPLKNLFDRLLGTAMDDSGLIPKPRLRRAQKYLLMTACNTPFPFSVLAGQSVGTLKAMHEFFKTSGMKQLGRVSAPGARSLSAPSAQTLQKIRRYWRAG